MASRGQLSEEMDKYQTKNELSYQELIKCRVFFLPFSSLNGSGQHEASMSFVQSPATLLCLKTSLRFTHCKSQKFLVGRESQLVLPKGDSMN